MQKTNLYVASSVDILDLLIASAAARSKTLSLRRHRPIKLGRKPAPGIAVSVIQPGWVSWRLRLPLYWESPLALLLPLTRIHSGIMLGYSWQLPGFRFPVS